MDILGNLTSGRFRLIETIAVRLPRVRFNLKTMLAGVAVVAVLLWADVMRRRVVLFRERAAHFAQRERGLQWEVVELEEMLATFPAASDRARSDGNAEFAEMYAKSSEQAAITLPLYRATVELDRHLKRKYERAASCPWLPVEPDDELFRQLRRKYERAASHD